MVSILALKLTANDCYKLSNAQDETLSQMAVQGENGCATPTIQCFRPWSRVLESLSWRDHLDPQRWVPRRNMSFSHSNSNHRIYASGVHLISA